MRYDEILQVRVTAELREKLRRRAKNLQVSVATLARWGLRFAATTSDVAGLLTQVYDAQEVDE